MNPIDTLAEAAASLAKLLLPGSVLFLMVGLSVGLLLLVWGRPRRKWVVGALLALVVGYWALATPLVASGLESLLGGRYRPIASAAEAGGARLVVVLTGGAVSLKEGDRSYDILSLPSAYRMLEAERLYHLLDGPTLLISGGPAGGASPGNPEAEAVRTELVDRGVPPEAIDVEAVSPDTHQQAILVRQWLEAHHVDSFVLVTSAAHMRRALGAFAAEGLTPIPSAAQDAPPQGPFRWRALVPSENALGRSAYAMREVLALVYYRARGWLG
jgi:uncharacterized SAM-binding protein YcdF (DUF218 family)